jgi:histidine triad (HIT) family protein
MASIFSQIIKGDIPCYHIAENDDFFAFLDIYPLMKGHTLVITKKEIDLLWDIEDALYAPFLLFTKKIARAISRSIPCVRVGMAVVGLEIPHAHIHLVPMNTMDDINFMRPKLKFTDSEFQETAALIRSNLPF